MSLYFCLEVLHLNGKFTIQEKKELRSFFFYSLDYNHNDAAPIIPESYPNSPKTTGTAGEFL